MDRRVVEALQVAEPTDGPLTKRAGAARLCCPSTALASIFVRHAERAQSSLPPSPLSTPIINHADHRFGLQPSGLEEPKPSIPPPSFSPVFPLPRLRQALFSLVHRMPSSLEVMAMQMCAMEEPDGRVNTDEDPDGLPRTASSSGGECKAFAMCASSPPTPPPRTSVLLLCVLGPASS